MSELPIVMFIFFLIILFPLINLVAVAMASCTVYFGTLQALNRASRQPDYPTSLNAFQTAASEFNASGLATFLRISPNGGYMACGQDLQIVETPVNGGASTEYTPNTAMPGKPDTTANMYEYKGSSVYQVAPFINLGFVPFIASVPAIGAPFPMCFQSFAPTEHTEGLTVAVTPVLSGGTTGINLNVPTGLDPASQYAGGGGTTWSNPGIFDNIENSGQQVLDQTVVSVAADNRRWTHTAVQVNSGDTVIIDYKADGTWKVGPDGSLVSINAAGTTAVPGADGSTGKKVGIMQGKVGNTTVFFGTDYKFSGQTINDTGELLLSNYSSPGANGPITTQVKDAYKKYEGKIDARVVVIR